MAVKKYEFVEEKPMIVAEPVAAYGSACRPVASVRPRIAVDEPRREEMREFCRTHFPDYVAEALEAQDFMFDQPFPADEESEEEMWERIERESRKRSNYISHDEALKYIHAWDACK